MSKKTEQKYVYILTGSLFYATSDADRANLSIEGMLEALKYHILNLFDEVVITESIVVDRENKTIQLATNHEDKYVFNYIELPLYE